MAQFPSSSPLIGGRPSVAQFQQYLPWFLEAMPSEQCAKVCVCVSVGMQGAGGEEGEGSCLVSSVPRWGGAATFSPSPPPP